MTCSIHHKSGKRVVSGLAASDAELVEHRFGPLTARFGRESENRATVIETSMIICPTVVRCTVQVSAIVKDNAGKGSVPIEDASKGVKYLQGPTARGVV